MVVRLYAFFSAHLVRMATPNRSAVKNALAKLVQAHMNLENTTRAKNNLKRAINNHLSATITRNNAIDHVLKKQGYKYSNANRANIVQRVGINANKQLTMINLRKLYNINQNTGTIKKLSMLRRARNAKQRIPGMKNVREKVAGWWKNTGGYKNNGTLIKPLEPIKLNNRSGAAVAVRNNNSGATVAGG
jgi:hypothetical protein